MNKSFVLMVSEVEDLDLRSVQYSTINLVLSKLVLSNILERVHSSDNPFSIIVTFSYSKSLPYYINMCDLLFDVAGPKWLS